MLHAKSTLHRNATKIAENSNEDRPQTPIPRSFHDQPLSSRLEWFYMTKNNF